MVHEGIMMRLTGCAGKTHVTWRTANRWYHAGLIPGAWKTPSGSIMIPDAEDDEDELMQDFTSIITSFCVRAYGQYQGKRKAELIKNQLGTSTAGAS